jgi:flavodoxin
MQVFYFSGTGNSLVVAQKITEALSDATLHPMVAALKLLPQKQYTDIR